jgi:hypothetical protein
MYDGYGDDVRCALHGYCDGRHPMSPFRTENEGGGAGGRCSRVLQSVLLLPRASAVGESTELWLLYIIYLFICRRRILSALASKYVPDFASNGD